VAEEVARSSVAVTPAPVKRARNNTAPFWSITGASKLLVAMMVTPGRPGTGSPTAINTSLFWLIRLCAAAEVAAIATENAIRVADFAVMVGTGVRGLFWGLTAARRRVISDIRQIRVRPITTSQVRRLEPGGAE
jgi:hypothetical protein